MIQDDTVYLTALDRSWRERVTRVAQLLEMGPLAYKKLGRSLPARTFQEKRMWNNSGRRGAPESRHIGMKSTRRSDNIAYILYSYVYINYVG